MSKPKCSLLKLLDTPETVKARVVSCSRRRKKRQYCIVIRNGQICGWKIIFKTPDYKLALAVLEKVLYRIGVIKF